MLEALRLLIDALDERGFLEEDLSSLALRSGQPYEAVVMAHTLLLAFDPAESGPATCASAFWRNSGNAVGVFPPPPVWWPIAGSR